MCLAPIIASAQAKERFEFRGLHLADTVTRDIEKAQRLSCRDDLEKVQGLAWCVPANRDFAGTEAFIVISLLDRKVESISMSFPTQNFATIAEAMETRWGQADSRTSQTVQNRMGASFDNTRMRWDLADSRVVLNRFGGKVTEGSLIAAHTELSGAAQKRRDCVKAKAAQKDLGGRLPEDCS